jgi:hypothetical protein
MKANIAAKFVALQEEVEKIQDENEKDIAIKEIAYHTQMWMEGNTMRLKRIEEEKTFTQKIN